MNSWNTYWQNALQKNKIAHAYLLKAFPGVNINEQLNAIILRIVNYQVAYKNKRLQSPQIYHLNSQETTLKKEKLLAVLEKLKLYAHGSGRKLLIIENIELASKNFINSLLKTIEEPPQNVTIFITTNAIAKVIPTIKSRCQIINIPENDKAALLKKVKSLNYKSNFSQLWVEIFNNFEELETFINPENDALIESAIETLKMTIKNPLKLIEFLTLKITKKEAFLVTKILSVLWRYEYNHFLKIENKKIAKVIANLRLKKLPAAKITLLLDAYNKQLRQNHNFFIQKEKLLINLKNLLLKIRNDSLHY